MTNFICKECGRSFPKKESRDFHTRDRHKPKVVKVSKSKEQVTTKLKKSEKKGVVLTSKHYVIIFGVGFFILMSIFFNGSKDDLSGELLDDTGDPLPQGNIHYHPKISIEIFGESIRIPDNLGLGSGGHLPVHTHEEGDGTLHWEVAVPTNTNMKLGYFFDISWRKSFNNECILDYCNGDEEGSLKFFVNGERNYEFGDYYVKDGDELRIVFD